MYGPRPQFCLSHGGVLGSADWGVGRTHCWEQGDWENVVECRSMASMKEGGCGGSPQEPHHPADIETVPVGTWGDLMTSQVTLRDPLPPPS